MGELTTSARRVAGGPLLEPVEPSDWALQPDDELIDRSAYPDPITRTRRHDVLDDGDVRRTSGITFLRRRHEEVPVVDR
jgi:hypothetical protein